MQINTSPWKRKCRHVSSKHAYLCVVVQIHQLYLPAFLLSVSVSCTLHRLMSTGHVCTRRCYRTPVTLYTQSDTCVAQSRAKLHETPTAILLQSLLFSFFCVCVYLFKTFFKQLYCRNGIPPLGNSVCFPQGKPAVTESRYPTYGLWWVFLWFRNLLNFDMDYKICNVRTDVNACDCTRGCTDTVRESALKIDSGRKIPCPHRGIEPASAACRSDALPTELHPLGIDQHRPLQGIFTR